MQAADAVSPQLSAIGCELPNPGQLGVTLFSTRGRDASAEVNIQIDINSIDRTFLNLITDCNTMMVHTGSKEWRDCRAIKLFLRQLADLALQDDSRVIKVVISSVKTVLIASVNGSSNRGSQRSAITTLTVTATQRTTTNYAAITAPKVRCKQSFEVPPITLPPRRILPTYLRVT